MAPATGSPVASTVTAPERAGLPMAMSWVVLPATTTVVAVALLAPPNQTAGPLVGWT